MISSAAVLPVDLSASHALQTLLDISLLGVILFRPVYAAGEADTIVDLAYGYLNPAAQSMLRLQVHPTQSFLTLYPHAVKAGIFAFYRDTFASGQPGRYEVNYQDDGLNNYFHLTAQRSGEWLLVSFSDTAEQPRTVVEIALRESQISEQAARVEIEGQRQRLYDMLEQSPAVVASYRGPTHVFDLVSHQFQQDFPTRTIKGLPIREALPELEGQQYYEILDGVYQTGEPFYGTELETWVDLTGTGKLELQYYNVCFQATRDAQGCIDGCLNFAYDATAEVLARQRVQHLNHELESRVTERTQQLAAALAEAERQRQQLRQQQDRLHQILAQVPAAIATLNGSEHRFSFVNERYQHLVDHRASLGAAVVEVLPEATEQGFIVLLDQVYQTGEPYLGTEVPLWQAQPGKPLVQHYVDFSYQPLYDEQAQVQGILVFAVDVTTQVRTRQASEASAQQLHLLTNALPVLIGYLDKDLRYQFANETYRAWYNQDPGALLGQRVRDLMGEKAYAATSVYMAQALAGERLDFETMLPSQDGFSKYIRTSYVPDVREGQVQGFYTLVYDITEQVEARQQVQHLNQELSARNAELGASNQQLTRTNVDLDNFIYTASHDLKEPISNIEGLLLAIEYELPPASLSDDASLMLGMMHEAIDRFKRTITLLTDISRLQKEYDSASTAVLLIPVLEEVRLDLLPLLQQTQARLEVQVPTDLRLTFSEKNLRSVVYNLLSNALKYRHPDRVPEVQISAEQREEYTVLEVTDNGLGLDLSRGYGQLFTMFLRLHTHVEGTGIGLYMVKKIIENAGGRIEVESQLGQGSTFRVVFKS